MERFPQMDLMMAETLIHAEKRGLLDTDFQECSKIATQELVVEGVVVTQRPEVVTGPPVPRSFSHSEEKSSGPITKAACEDSSPN